MFNQIHCVVLFPIFILMDFLPIKKSGNQICLENSQELRRTKTDIENNLSTALQLIKSEGERKKEDNLRKETEFVGLAKNIYNQYHSQDVPYGRLTRVYTRGAYCRIKRASSLSCCSLDFEYFSSYGTEFSDFSSRISQREPYSSFVNTVETLSSQKSTETNELEANELRQIRSKNAELENALSELRAELKSNEERAMSKTSDLMALIEGKEKCHRIEASNQKKKFTDEINVMQQNLESVCNKNTDLESQLENQREKVSHLEENLAETVSTKQNLLKEKQGFIERIKELESQCNKEKDLEEQLRDAMWEINALHKKKSELKLQNEQSHKEYSETTKKLTETIDLMHEENKRSKRNKQLMERKMEELAEGIRQTMEDNICILHRRVLVAELLNKENKDIYKSTKQKYEEQSKMFGEKTAIHEDEIRMLREKVLKLEADMSKEELAEGIRQTMEDNIRILHRRVHVAELLNNENKDTYNSTKQKYEEQSKMFGEKTADYEDEIRMLREKVLKLEADMSKEEDEKMNLMKTVTQLESKMMKLEKKLKEKDDELVRLGENKKEAIRQLCFSTEFHRDRCLYLQDLMLNMRIKNMK